MTSSETVTAIEAFADSWASRDAERIAAHLTEDVVLTPPKSIAGPVEGVDKVAAVLSGAAAAKFLEVETVARDIRRIIADGPNAAVLLTLTAKLKAGGDYENAYCWLFECREGSIAAITEFTDTNHAIRAFSAKS